MRVETLVITFLVMIYLALNPDWSPRDMTREIIGTEHSRTGYSSFHCAPSSHTLH